MKYLQAMLLLSLFANLSIANEEETITDQQQCEEWAKMDGIAAENSSEYIADCLTNLQYDDETEVVAED